MRPMRMPSPVRRGSSGVAKVLACCALVGAALPAGGLAAEQPLVVNLDNYVRAETDRYFTLYGDDGYFGTLRHDRAPPSLDEPEVIRANRDVLHSVGIFDLSEAITFVTPSSATRLQSMQVVNQDHYTVAMEYGGAEIELTEESVGSRYGLVMFRTQVDGDDVADIAEANAMQDAIEWQQSDPGEMSLPQWDEESLGKVREAILGLSPFISGSHGMFGDRNDVDPIRHLWGTAAGWLGQPIEDAYFMTFSVAANDGVTPHILTLPVKVPVTGFWSLSVYDQQGRFLPDAEDASSLTSTRADANEDGSVTIQFGGNPEAPNYLAIAPGWSYTLRFYRPAEALVSGQWIPPSPIPIALPGEGGP